MRAPSTRNKLGITLKSSQALDGKQWTTCDVISSKAHLTTVDKIDWDKEIVFYFIRLKRLYCNKNIFFQDSQGIWYISKGNEVVGTQKGI